MPREKITLGFIGAGRVGTGLASGFARAEVEVLAVASRSVASARALAKRVPGARACAPQLDTLRKAVADGALAGGFHPLHMFGEAGESAGALAGCAIALAGPDTLVEKLERLARILDAKPLRLPEGGRALYHAAANFSGAFVIALIQETISLWGKLGIAEADALAALLPLLRGTADNVERLGAAGGLGSAIARGDAGT
ncbi:MAG: DUF2520 domain-containing protein, partial [Betaproteobacteria bacterium]